ncbi:uncharacterized protein AB9X84_003335 [Acanthopagrus schlegelii]
MAHVFGSSWTVLLLVSITVMLLQSQAVQGNGCFYWLFSCFKPQQEPDNTVPNLKEDVLTKCTKVVSDSARCNKFWDHFTAAFINKDPTTVGPEAYKDLIQSEPIPVKTEVLLWSKTSDMITWLSEQNIKHYFHLGETIYGSLDVPNAVWCGQRGKQEVLTSRLHNTPSESCQFLLEERVSCICKGSDRSGHSVTEWSRTGTIQQEQYISN